MQFQISSRRKIGKEIPQSSRLVSSRLDCLTSYSRFTFVKNTISTSPKVPRSKFLESDEFFCFISICKFAIFKNPCATINSLSKLYFRFRRFILLLQVKEGISINYDSSTSS